MKRGFALAAFALASLGMAGVAPAHPGHGTAAKEAKPSAPYSRQLRSYRMPDVRLVDAAGRAFAVRDALEHEAPVIVNFIFTSCTAICPVMTGTFAQVQRRFEKDGESVSLVSISLDPEQDTPARLREYAERFDAGPQWRFVTGSAQDSVAVQKAFDVYRGDKMGHDPVTFIRARAGTRWIRLEGFASASQIVDEYHRLLAEDIASAATRTHAH